MAALRERRPSALPPMQATQITGMAIGRHVPDLPALLSPDGKEYSLASFGDLRLVVLAFLGNACPAVKACLGPLVALQAAHQDQGVQVIGVNSNNEFLSSADSPAEMARRSAEWSLNFPYLKDTGGRWARRLGALNTPHFLVLDEERRLRYRGRMFDSRDPARATTRDLQTAVEDLLERRPVRSPETTPLGCSIVW